MNPRVSTSRDETTSRYERLHDNDDDLIDTPIRFPTTKVTMFEDERSRSVDHLRQEATPTHLSHQQQHQIVPPEQLTSHLQLLLSEERSRSEQIKGNYTTLKNEHLKLQTDFLSLQSEMKSLLEETSSFRNRKDNEIKSLQDVLQEKDRLTEDLKREIKERDPVTLREKLREELSQPIQRLEKERDLLTRDNEKLSYEIKMSQIRIDQLEKEVTDSVERTRLSFESELNVVRREKEEIRVKLTEMSQTPDNVKMRQATEENQRLHRKINNLKLTIEDNETSYKRIQSKLESLVTEHQQQEQEMTLKMTALKSQLEAVKDASRDYTRLKEDYQTMKKDYSILQEEHPRMKAELMEAKILSRELQRQKDRYREEYHRLKQLLDEERKELSDFKNIAEMNISRLRRSIEGERQENENRIKSLDRELILLRKERDDLKIKYKGTTEVLSELRMRMTTLERTTLSFFQTKVPPTGILPTDQLPYHQTIMRRSKSEGHTLKLQDKTTSSTLKPTTARKSSFTTESRQPFDADVLLSKMKTDLSKTSPSKEDVALSCKIPKETQQDDQKAMIQEHRSRSKRQHHQRYSHH